MPLALLLTAILFAVFLLAKLVDAFIERLTSARGERLSPWIVMIWARIALRLFGLRTEHLGAPMQCAGVIAANHSSWIDIVVLQSIVQVDFVAKSEVATWPGVGLIGRQIGTVFVERRATQARAQSRVLEERLREGRRLCVFPEGTSSDGRRILPFKSSLFAALENGEDGEGRLVQPVTIAYRPQRTLPYTFYSWWGEMEFASHLCSVLALSERGLVQVVFSDPINPRDFPDRKLLAQACETRVREDFELVKGGGELVQGDQRS